MSSLKYLPLQPPPQESGESAHPELQLQVQEVAAALRPQEDGRDTEELQHEVADGALHLRARLHQLAHQEVQDRDGPGGGAGRGGQTLFTVHNADSSLQGHSHVRGRDSGGRSSAGQCRGHTHGVK